MRELLLCDKAHDTNWDEAAVFEKKITTSSSERAVGAVRNQTGALKTRELESAQPSHQLPGVSDDDYIVIVYRSSLPLPRLRPKRSRQCAMRTGTGAGYLVK